MEPLLAANARGAWACPSQGTVAQSHCAPRWCSYTQFPWQTALKKVVPDLNSSEVASDHSAVSWQPERRAKPSLWPPLWLCQGRPCMDQVASCSSASTNGHP